MPGGDIGLLVAVSAKYLDHQGVIAERGLPGKGVITQYNGIIPPLVSGSLRNGVIMYYNGIISLLVSGSLRNGVIMYYNGVIPPSAYQTVLHLFVANDIEVQGLGDPQSTTS